MIAAAEITVANSAASPRKFSTMTARHPIADARSSACRVGLMKRISGFMYSRNTGSMRAPHTLASDSIISVAASSK